MVGLSFAGAQFQAGPGNERTSPDERFSDCSMETLGGFLDSEARGERLGFAPFSVC